MALILLSYIVCAKSEPIVCNYVYLINQQELIPLSLTYYLKLPKASSNHYYQSHYVLITLQITCSTSFLSPSLAPPYTHRTPAPLLVLPTNVARLRITSERVKKEITETVRHTLTPNPPSINKTSNDLKYVPYSGIDFHFTHTPTNLFSLGNTRQACRQRICPDTALDRRASKCSHPRRRQTMFAGVRRSSFLINLTRCTNLCMARLDPGPNSTRPDTFSGSSGPVETFHTSRPITFSERWDGFPLHSSAP